MGARAGVVPGDTSACLLCNEIFWGWPGGGRTRGYPRLATLQWNILRWPAGRSPCGKKTKIRQPWHFMISLLKCNAKRWRQQLCKFYYLSESLYVYWCLIWNQFNGYLYYTDNTWHSKEILSRVFSYRCELKRDTNIHIFKNLDLQKFCSEVG